MTLKIGWLMRLNIASEPGSMRLTIGNLDEPRRAQRESHVPIGQHRAGEREPIACARACDIDAHGSDAIA